MPFQIKLARSRILLMVAGSVLACAPACPGGTGGVPAPEATASPLPLLGGRFSLSLESAYLFQPIPNPFFAIAGRHNENPLDYHLATQVVSIRCQVTKTDGPGVLRGNLELSAGILGSAIVRGPESFYTGFVKEFRCTFSPRSLSLKSYAEVRGALGWTDFRRLSLRAATGSVFQLPPRPRRSLRFETALERDARFPGSIHLQRVHDPS